MASRDKKVCWAFAIDVGTSMQPHLARVFKALSIFAQNRVRSRSPAPKRTPLS